MNIVATSRVLLESYGLCMDSIVALRFVFIYHYAIWHHTKHTNYTQW